MKALPGNSTGERALYMGGGFEARFVRPGDQLRGASRSIKATKPL